MNRLNFRTLNFGHKAGHVMYHYVSLCTQYISVFITLLMQYSLYICYH